MQIESWYEFVAYGYIILNNQTILIAMHCCELKAHPAIIHQEIDLITGI
jgi:hypothetical protein